MRAERVKIFPSCFLGFCWPHVPADGCGLLGVAMLRGEEFEKDIYSRLTLLDENLPFFTELVLTLVKTFRADFSVHDTYRMSWIDVLLIEFLRSRPIGSSQLACALQAVKWTNCLEVLKWLLLSSFLIFCPYFTLPVVKKAQKLPGSNGLLWVAPNSDAICRSTRLYTLDFVLAFW